MTTISDTAAGFQNIDTATSYATEDNLRKALDRKGLANYRPLVVRNRAGRWTAIFGLSFTEHNPMWVANHGFKVLG